MMAYSLHTLLLALLLARAASSVELAQSQKPPNNTTTAGAVALCALAKDEHGNMREWARYHLWLGVSHIYVFDHGSHPPLAVELEELVQAGQVDIVYFSNTWSMEAAEQEGAQQQAGRTQQQQQQQDVGGSTGNAKSSTSIPLHFVSPQAWAYDRCFRWFGARHTWMGLLDPDEYLVILPQEQLSLTRRPDLGSVLATYSGSGGVMVHWQLMGSAGRTSRPPFPAPLAYTQCVSVQQMMKMAEFAANPMGFMKSFTQTRYYGGGGCDPHHCTLRPGAPRYVTNDQRVVTASSAAQPAWFQLAVFHYVTRSEEDWGRKMARGSGHSQYVAEVKAKGIRSRGWDYFKLIDYMASHSRQSPDCLAAARTFYVCCTQGVCACNMTRAAAAKLAGLPTPPEEQGAHQQFGRSAVQDQQQPVQAAAGSSLEGRQAAGTVSEIGQTLLQQQHQHQQHRLSSRRRGRRRRVGVVGAAQQVVQAQGQQQQQQPQDDWLLGQDTAGAAAAEPVSATEVEAVAQAALAKMAAEVLWAYSPT